jgi:hypothetical protein
VRAYVTHTYVITHHRSDTYIRYKHSVGWYSAIQFPSASVWMQVGQISKFSPRDKRHLFCYYQRGA